MAKAIAQLVHPFVKVTGSFPSADTFLVSARVDEGLSRITAARIVLATRAAAMGLDELLGTRIGLEITAVNDTLRHFRGTCIEAEYLGMKQGYELFAVETRTWPWFLTQSVNTRIFQEKSVTDIIKQVCGDLGFTQLDVSKLSGSYKPRTYVVQYDESDFDFISRLMEEEGIYYFFDHTEAFEKMILADGLGAHEPIKETPVLEFYPRVQQGKRWTDTVFEWSDLQRVVTGKVSLVDYEFLTPKTKLGVTSILKKGKHQKNDIEVYSMAGHYAKPAEGEGYARIRAERAAQNFERWRGAGNARTLAAGATFKLKGHERLKQETDFLVVEAEHYIQVEIDQGNPSELEQYILDRRLVFPSQEDYYLNRFEVMRKADPYRPPAITPWPDLSGLHTAVVTGPSGEEIYTDEHGRIKVQFHWDRAGQNDDKTSCWVRVAQPWANKGFGTQLIPRIGAEVIIMFERNNPDRPICIGSLYNAINTVPYALPDNMTQQGIKTNSSKGGGGFNELVMEDKKGEEFVRFQSEKDYTQIVKNKATITIGMEKKDPGTLSETVHGNVTETYNDNHTYALAHNLKETIKEGDMTTQIEKGNKNVWLDEGNLDTYLTKGSHWLTLDEGDYTTELTKGTHDTTVTKGDYMVTVSDGQVWIEASKSISLVVGQSELHMKDDGTITLNGKDITVEGTGNIKAKATMNLDAEGGINTTVKAGASGTFDGGGMATVKGGMVKIN